MEGGPRDCTVHVDETRRIREHRGIRGYCWVVSGRRFIRDFAEGAKMQHRKGECSIYGGCNGNM